MTKKGKLALGLLVSIVVIPAVVGDSESMKGEAAAVSTENSTLLTGNKGGEAEGIETVNVEEEDEEDREAVPATDLSKGSTAGATFSEDQLKEIKAVISQSLKNNPEMIVEALQKFTERQQQEQHQKMQDGFIKNKDRIADPASGILLGKPDAETKLVVFMDPNCPHCRTFEEALHKVRGEHPNVAILLKYWPILGEDSKEVARGILALKDTGKNEELSKLVTTTKGPLTYDTLRTWVAKQKINPSKFDQDAKSSAIGESLDKTDALAKELGLQGTPTSLLISKDGVRLVMPTDEKSLDSILRGGVKVSAAAA